MVDHPRRVADALDATADLCRTIDISDWTAEDHDRALRSLDIVAVEVVGLAARIRAAKVNNTPRPVPMKPRPAPKPGTTKPPPKPGKGR